MTQEDPRAKEAESAPAVRLRLRDVLWGVFFFPHVILPLLVAPGTWGRAWRIFTSCFVISVLLLGLVHLPRYRDVAARECAYLAAQIGQVKVEEHGRLSFPTVKPETEISFQDVPCILHFAKPEQALAPDEVKAKEHWCIWISDSLICLLNRLDVDSDFQVVMVTGNGDWPWAKAWAQPYFAELNAMMVQGSILKEGQVAALFLEINQLFIPGIFLRDRVVIYAALMSMMLAIAAVLWLFPITRVLGDGKIGSTLSLFFYAGIPALAVATIWCLVPGASLNNFPYIYLWTLAGYLAVVLFVLRRLATVADDDDMEE